MEIIFNKDKHNELVLEVDYIYTRGTSDRGPSYSDGGVQGDPPECYYETVTLVRKPDEFALLLDECLQTVSAPRQAELRAQLITMFQRVDVTEIFNEEVTSERIDTLCFEHATDNDDDEAQGYRDEPEDYV
jgi:hypothetical protein